MLDVDRGVASRFTSRPGINITPVWSPDGRTILFASDAPPNLFRKDASGASEEQRLTQSPNPQFPMDWSRDGRFILYEEDTAPGNQRSLWILPRRQVTASRDLTRGRHSTNAWAISLPTPAGWLFSPTNPGGTRSTSTHFQSRVERCGFPRAEAFFRNGAPTGASLFYISPDSMLMSVSLKPGGDSLEPSAPRALFPLLVIDTDVSPYDVAPRWAALPGARDRGTARSR